MPAPAGTKSMNAKLSVSPYKEMKTDVIKWAKSVPEVAKLFAKPITYQDKIDLNPKKWNEGKLSKAMVVLVRAELQLLATRTSDAKKQHATAKSPKEHNKVLQGLQKGFKDVVSDIHEKCDTALEELASGKSEAKAGIALGKKAMAKVSALKASAVFTDPLNVAMKTLKDWLTPTTAGDDAKAAKALAAAQKEMEKALTDLTETGKAAQNIAKFLLDTGKKLKNHENGQLAAFGTAIMAKEVQPELAKLDTDLDKLDTALTSYADALKKGTLTVDAAKRYQSAFKQMLPLQKTADKAVAAMKKLETKFKSIEKDLK